MKNNKIQIEVSSRHIHLSRAHASKLFGKGYELTPMKDLSQPSEFASAETLTLKNGQRELSNVRVIGPIREYTQVEISKTDAYKLKINPPFRMSSDIKDSESITLVGPRGKVKIKEGVIIALRHIHASVQEAQTLGLRNNQVVNVRVAGERELVFHKVKVRVKDNYALRMHIDTDEANASGIEGQKQGVIEVK